MNIKLTCFVRPKPFGKRLALVTGGVTVQGFGLAVLRMIELGVDPCSCLTQGVANHIALSFGTCQVLCHLITFLFVIKFDMSYIGFGTIANMCFLGYISDFFVSLLTRCIAVEALSSSYVRYVLLVPGLICMLCGAAAYMCAGLGSSPYDAAPFIISEKIGKIPFKAMRMLWDISFMTIGFLLGGNVGAVTVAVAFFCGPVVSLVQKYIQKILDGGNRYE